MGTTHFFNRFNSVSEGFDLTQLMTYNGFTRIDSNKLMTQKASRVLIQINSRLKKLSRLLIQIGS